MDKIDRIKELVEQLNKASDAYYNSGHTLMSDKEFDGLFDELSFLEKETGLIIASSPTQNVGYEVKSELKKVKHNHPMLSLDKTKDVNDVGNFLSGRDGVVMAKMDGLTCSLHYVNGELISAETRGDGEIGEDILHCARVIKNIPLKVNHPGELIIDGEVIITYKDFDKMNAQLPDDQKYKNPRNLASGSIRQLDSGIAAQRNMRFVAWKLIKGYGGISFCDRYAFMTKLGFDTAPMVFLNSSSNTEDIQRGIRIVKQLSEQASYPIDGCVFGYDDVVYGESLGATGHHLRSQLAYKFYDETYETELLNIEWTVGRTGTITPTSVFSPVEIDGTLVERASVHNISVLTQLDLHVGDIIEVYKANMIIPQVSRNVSAEGRICTDYIIIPSTCPVCGGTAEIKNTDNSKILVCTNPDCAAKKLAQFTHFVSRNCMNIDGLSERTLEVFISKGYLKIFRDIYDLHKYRNELIHLDGFGPKSIDKLLASIEKSKNVKLENFIAALGIDGIGLSAAKTISKYCNGSFDKFGDLFENNFNWTKLEDFGEVTANNLDHYYDWHHAELYWTASEMNFIIPEHNNDNSLDGLKFCITGSFSQSRDELKKQLEAKGAKFVSSVSKNLDVLFAGDKAGSKLTKAQQLDVKVMNEDELMNMLGG